MSAKRSAFLNTASRWLGLKRHPSSESSRALKHHSEQKYLFFFCLNPRTTPKAPRKSYFFPLVFSSSSPTHDAASGFSRVGGGKMGKGRGQKVTCDLCCLIWSRWPSCCRWLDAGYISHSQWQKWCTLTGHLWIPLSACYGVDPTSPFLLGLPPWMQSFWEESFQAF